MPNFFWSKILPLLKFDEMCFGDLLKMFLIGAGAAAVAYFAVSITMEITYDIIRKKAREREARAKWAFVNELKNARTVNIGLFDDSGEELCRMDIESDKGISKEVRVGQKIYL